MPLTAMEEAFLKAGKVSKEELDLRVKAREAKEAEQKKPTPKVKSAFSQR